MSDHPKSNSKDEHNARESWVDKVSISALIILGVLGLGVEIVDLLANLFEPLAGFETTLEASSTLTLLMLAFLSIGIGLERLSYIGDRRNREQTRHEEIVKSVNSLFSLLSNLEISLQQGLNEVSKSLVDRVHFVVLRNHDAVYKSAIQLVENSRPNEIIRTTSLTGEDKSQYDETIYQDYFIALAKRISDAKHAGYTNEYRVVLGYSLDEWGEPPAHKQRSISRRRIQFKDKSVLDRLRLRRINTTWSLDVLIVGYRDLIIGFPTFTVDQSIRLGVQITDEEFVQQVVRWYDDYLWASADTVNWVESNETSAGIN